MRRLNLILLQVPVQVKFALVLLFPLLLSFIPMDWLNRQDTICLFKNLTGRECWGCGITRAVISAVQFDFATAFHYNKLIVVVFPLLVYEWGKIITKSYARCVSGSLKREMIKEI